MPTQPLILVTNDDGIDSTGLLAAAEAVADLGQLLIVAPATQQTGMGRSTPGANTGAAVQVTLKIAGRELAAYAVPGSPAQAVMYAVLALAGRRPALALAGINYGENLGTATSGSGTVGAALEAAAFGIPALAVSLETTKDYHYKLGQDVDWSVAAHMARYFAAALLARRLPFDVDVLKIDVPVEATADTPWRVTRQSRQSYYQSFNPGPNPLPGLEHFDYDVAVNHEALEPDSDIWAFARDRAIAVTPLSIDLTSRTDLRAMESLLRAAERQESG